MFHRLRKQAHHIRIARQLCGQCWIVLENRQNGISGARLAPEHLLREALQDCPRLLFERVNLYLGIIRFLPQDLGQLRFCARLYRFNGGFDQAVAVIVDPFLAGCEGFTDHSKHAPNLRVVLAQGFR